MKHKAKINLTKDALLFLYVFVTFQEEDVKEKRTSRILLSPVFQFMELVSDKKVIELRELVKRLNRKTLDGIWTIQMLVEDFISHDFPIDFLKGELELGVLRDLKSLRAKKILGHYGFFLSDRFIGFLILYIFFGFKGLIGTVMAMQKLYQEPIALSMDHGRVSIVFNERVSMTQLKKWLALNFNDIENRFEENSYFNLGLQGKNLLRDLMIYTSKLRGKKNFSIEKDIKGYGYNLTEDHVKKIIKRFKRDIFDKYFVP